MMTHRELSAVICLLMASSFLAGAHMIRSANSISSPPPPKFTTPDIADIFIGRCNDHVQCLQQDKCIRRTLQGTCQDLWRTFLAAFANKDPCQAGYDDYDDVITMATPYVEENKSLFWSGVFKLALNAARVTTKYSILEESLLGYTANNLTWCGQLNATGISFDNPCPYRCANDTLYTYWKAASRAFARQANGTIHVVLNGSRSDAFRANSTFATNELPNLNRDAVTHVMILLVYDISISGDNVKAKCDEGSILDMQNQLTSRGFSYTCVEDPEDFKFLQCTADPENARCNPHQPQPSTHSSANSLSAALATVLLSHVVFQLATRSKD